jgi:hypothetical protein
MAVVAVSDDNTRLDAADAVTDWDQIGAGPAEEANPDFVYQNTASITRQGTLSRDGVVLTDDVTSDISGAGTYNTVIFKAIVTTPGLLETLANRGMSFYIGSDASNHYVYDVHGNDTYPLTRSWLIVPIDPNVVVHRSNTIGTPVLTAADWYGMDTIMTGTARDDNLGLDAVDIGAGLTLVGGDGGDTDGVWQDFVDYDEGTVANRFGYAINADGFGGIFVIIGMMNIGTATATVFNDSGVTLIFSDGLFAAGFSGITIDLQTGTTDVDFIDTNFFGKGTEAGEDTRPVLTVTGTSGAFDADGCVFDTFDTLTLTSACTLTGGKITNCEAVTQSSATLDGIEISGASTADGVAFITSNNPANIKNCNFTFSDGHAIEFDTTGTYTFDGNVFTGYGADGTNDAAVYNNSGGLITLDMVNAAEPTVRNGPGASTVMNTPVTLTVTVKDESGATIQNAQTAIIRISDGEVFMNEDTDVDGIAEVNVNLGAGTDVSVRVRKGSTADDPKYFPVNSPQTTTSTGLDITITLIEDEINTA